MLVAILGSVAYAGDNISDLKSFDELRNDFNNQAGKVRVVTLLSPT